MDDVTVVRDICPQVDYFRSHLCRLAGFGAMLSVRTRNAPEPGLPQRPRPLLRQRRGLPPLPPSPREGRCTPIAVSDSGGLTAAQPMRWPTDRTSANSWLSSPVRNAAERTDNPHGMVNRWTESGRGPASTAYVSHVLDVCGFPPRMIGCTGLLDRVNTMDPERVAAAFGMAPRPT
ncbi:hypothetical protein GCM10010518_00130 [Kitasatospora cinereorecta]